MTSSNLCSWQGPSQYPSWIELPALEAATYYGRATIRFSVLPNATGQPRTGTFSVGGQIVTVSQDSEFNTLRDEAGNYPSSASTGTLSASISPAVRARTSLGAAGAPHGALRAVPSPRLSTSCGSSFDLPMPITLQPNGFDQSGNGVTVTLSRTASGCGPGAAPETPFPWLHVSPASYPQNSPLSVAFTITADPNTGNSKRTGIVDVVTGESKVSEFKWTVSQLGIAVAPLSVPSSLTLQATASSEAIPVSSANPSAPACSWSVDPTTLPDWITPTATNGACGSQLQFSYAANPAGSLRRAILRFTSGDQTELDQAAGAPPCTYGFQETNPQNVPASGGSVTFNVVTAAGCTWSPGTDSSDWISFPQSATGPGPGSVDGAGGRQQHQQPTAGPDLRGRRHGLCTAGRGELPGRVRLHSVAHQSIRSEYRRLLQFPGASHGELHVAAYPTCGGRQLGASAILCQRHGTGNGELHRGCQSRRFRGAVILHYGGGRSQL